MPVIVAFPARQPGRKAIAVLHAMIVDPTSTATAANIEAQAARVLADPNLVNIGEAGRMEDFISSLIVHGTSRSDAILDPAIRHFTWDADRPEFDHHAVLGAALKKGDDKLLTDFARA